MGPWLHMPQGLHTLLIVNKRRSVLVLALSRHSAKTSRVGASRGRLESHYSITLKKVDLISKASHPHTHGSKQAGGVGANGLFLTVVVLSNRFDGRHALTRRTGGEGRVLERSVLGSRCNVVRLARLEVNVLRHRWM